MLEILQINVRIEMTLQSMDETVNFSYNVQFFCSGSRDSERVPMTSSTGSHPHAKTTF